RSNTRETIKTYKSKPVTVKVKELPPHPLSSSVAVGEFRLDDRIIDTNLKTGQSAAYEFNIVGEGNIASLPQPKVRKDGALEIYDPSTRQELSKSRNRITGTKSFRYFMIPKEPGQHKLGDYFQWVFFSPQRERYDTLRSNVTVYITGESKQNETIDAQDPGSFYEQIQVADNQLRAASGGNRSGWWFHGFLLVMVGASVFLRLKKYLAFYYRIPVSAAYYAPRNISFAMSNSFGRLFRLHTIGESHGPAIGCVVDGCPAGVNIDEEFIQSELARRKPGQSKITTQRQEEDRCRILSGVFEGKSTGTPIAI